MPVHSAAPLVKSSSAVRSSPESEFGPCSVRTEITSVEHFPHCGTLGPIICENASWRAEPQFACSHPNGAHALVTPTNTDVNDLQLVKLRSHRLPSIPRTSRMKISTSILPPLSVLVAALINPLCFQAQVASLATNPWASPFFQSVDLSDGKKKRMDFTIKARGSVKGQVFRETEPESDASAPRAGVAGVKVSLRSGDAAYKNWVWVQSTDDTGSYLFEGLRSGAYTIEIDPGDLPASVGSGKRTSRFLKAEGPQISNVSLQGATKGEVNGTLYEDKNGNGKYDLGKDFPVPNAVITFGDSIAVSDSSGSYQLIDLPAGRIDLVVRWPNIAELTHVVLDLADKTSVRRVVNIEFQP
jgi:hypothetical protein